MVILSAARSVAIYSVFIGIFMIGFWCMLLVTNQVPADQKPYAIAFHLAGEFLTAAMLIASGFGSWRNKRWAKVLTSTALGLLLYTVIVSPGYYAQLGNLPMIALFAALTIITVLALALQFRPEKRTK